MAEVLEGSHAQPKLIGLFSCRSEDNFGDFLRLHAPRSATILTGGKTKAFMDVANILGALNALMSLKCEEEFAESISTGGTNRLSGFFR